MWYMYMYNYTFLLAHDRDGTPAGECGVCGVECGRWDGGGRGLEQRRPLTMDGVRVSTPLFPWRPARHTLPA